MHFQTAPFSAARTAFALVATALVATAAHAMPRALSETEMSDVRGADGSILAGIAPSISDSSSQNQNAFTKGLSAAFTSSTGSTLLTPAEFAAALAPTGMTPGMFASYDGQPVVQTKVDAAPITFSFDLSALLLAPSGQTYSGPSMGMITLKDFDARGTTIWVWQHH